MTSRTANFHCALAVAHFSFNSPGSFFEICRLLVKVLLGLEVLRKAVTSVATSSVVSVRRNGKSANAVVARYAIRKEKILYGYTALVVFYHAVNPAAPLNVT